MKLTFTPRQRIWLRRLLILFIIRTVIWGALYYIVVYRFKDIMRITMRRESKGLYAFDASEVDFSLWRKNIVVQDAVLRCTDTLRLPRHYEVHVPEIYLAIDSWTALIFHRRLVVDSLHITEPSIKTHTHAGAAPISKPVTFHASRILELLQKLVVHLQVRSLVVQDGAFRYSNTKNEIPFISDHINLSIRNFSRKERQADHLFSSDDVDLSISPQHWLMPDGIHEVSFRRLHFSGKDQLFELDSCTFHAAAVGNRAEASVSADKFFFNSRNLSAIYEREELLIDTLICYRPVLNWSVLYTKDREDSSSLAVNQAVRHFFKYIHFSYIDIREGKLLLDHPLAYTKRTNLKIYNLRINPDSQPLMRADSVRLSLSGSGKGPLPVIPGLRELVDVKALHVVK